MLLKNGKLFLHEGEVESLGVRQFRQLGIVAVMPVKDVEKPLQADLAATCTKDTDDTDILQPDRGRDNIQVGVSELVSRQAISVLFIARDKTADVAQGVALEFLEDAQVANERRVHNLRLVNRRNAFIECIERLCL